ncbi:zinc-dependent alcohol dehydrogenase [Rhodopirellula halodulae]|uniref:zinc-dependent alcohol dehydrogenase n=1 Tax=Rhodopirellula halodulae TaxID=2894198 RepID=UPI001E658CDB|nr:alcohol dehydrogenase catalytic domain-containing protein [Rhodopirellula sp. JC737]MCC9654289.1 alcohol dehydrogenase catalytic domain-containing protein [Rhodopirellula sp. JC737]
MSQVLDSQNAQQQAGAPPQTVRAVAMTAPGQTEMRTYPYPTMDHDSAILKVDMSGICGTDRHIFKGEATELRGKSIYPYVGGHEVIGTIVEIGGNAAKTMDYDKQVLKVGDRVAIAVEVNCGHCVYCRKHYNNTTCLNQIQAYGLHPNADTLPYLRGGFAEYMYIRPGTHLFKVPEEMPTDIAVFVEEMAVAYHSLARAAGPFAPVNEGFGPGMSVAVLGNGPLGILHGIMASIHGAGLRIATDLSELRLGKAKHLYADVTLNAAKISEEERIAQVKDMTDGVGPDLVIESAGEPEAFIEALKMVRKGGTVIEVGNWVDLGKPVDLDVMQHISSKNLHIHSVFHCGTDWRPVLNILNQQSDRYDFPSLITHRFGLDELVEKFGTVTDFDECCKIEVLPHKS